MSKVRILGIGSPSGDDQAGWLTVDALADCGVQSEHELAIDKLDRPGASLIGLVAVCAGLSLSWFKDTPAGPSIVVSAAALFLLSFVLPRRTV